MFEAHVHNSLKVLLQKNSSIWPHNLTLSRLVARSLRRRDKSLLQLPIGIKECWWLGVLIPLCVESSDSVLVLSLDQRSHLIKNEIPRLKKEGFTLSIWEGTEPPPKGKIWVLNYDELAFAYKNNFLRSKQLIIPEAEFFSERLRNALSIEIRHSHWEQLRRAYPSFDSDVLDIYQRITSRLFVSATCEDAQILIDDSEVTALKNLLEIIGISSSLWSETVNAIGEGWASWAKLNHQFLDWTWHLQPLEPLNSFKEILKVCPFVLITGSWKNDLLLNELESINCLLNVSVRLGGIINQEPIQLFVPYRQPLPNTEYFEFHLLDQCRRLILGLQGITIILLDDYHLRSKLTAHLAAEFGRRVVHETTAPDSNGVISCSYSWWLNYHKHLPIPSQLIFGILPFASLESPLLSARVHALKKQGRDWFRDLLLPEVLSQIPYIVDPVRNNHSRVAILDGRLRSRSWGEFVFRALEPWNPLDRLLPY